MAKQTSRFIPAFAGNAPAPPWPTVQRPVHPRVCGERRPGQNVPVHPAGSSPRLRGTLGARVVVQVKRRFIPAFAGNAVLMPLSAEEMAVHPRVCGERQQMIIARPTNTGSSPRLRGTLKGQLAGPLRLRFIPAFAGNASAPARRTDRVAVHPRVCGERIPCSTQSWSTCGSSPRLRGTPRATPATRSLSRFIPAFAGNATYRLLPVYWATVHPRVCGERMSMPSRAADRNGSSPRLRGTRLSAHNAGNC